MAEEFNNIEDYIESDYQLIPEESEKEPKKNYTSTRTNGRTYSCFRYFIWT